MRIGIDARMIFMSGIGTYLRNLIKGLRRLGEDHEYVVIIQDGDRERFHPPGENFSLIFSRARPYSLSEQVGLARLVEAQNLDLVHHPHYAAPMFGRTPMVATIHDLIHQLFPEQCPSKLAWRVSRLLAKRTAGRARIILTVSEHSRRDIIKHLGVAPDKVRLTYNALPPGWGEEGQRESFPGLKAGDLFFLYVGNHKKHKNIPLLLEAFAGVRRRMSGVRLLLTGSGDGLKDEMARRGLGGEVEFLGDVPHEALEGIYAAARALVFPSSYEGFGYPPLEAMGCGTPAIVSDVASLPEVVGEAGIVVPEGCVEPLREAMVRLLEDDSLRASLSLKARKQARKFSWRALAEETLKAYRDALPENRNNAAASGGGT